MHCGEVDIFVNFLKFRSINKINSERKTHDIANNISRFITYLKTLEKTENNPNYLYSKYTLYLSKDGEPEDDENTFIIFYKKKSDSFDKVLIVGWENDNDNKDYETILTVKHYYERVIILSELDHCPLKLLESKWYGKNTFGPTYNYTDSFNALKIKVGGNVCLQDILSKFEPYLTEIKSKHELNKKEGYDYIESKFLTMIKCDDDEISTSASDFYEFFNCRIFIEHGKNSFPSGYMILSIFGHHQYKN